MLSNSVNSNSSVMSSSNVVESGSSAKAASAHSSDSVAEKSAKVAPREVRPLKERTSVRDVNDQVRDLKITEKNGDVVTAALRKPSYQFAEEVDDARMAIIPSGRNSAMQVFTTTRYQKKLFHIFQNVAINNKPTAMNFSLADNHLEAFRWFIRQANSFLRSKFGTA